jgi:hypothetical protein
MQPIHHDHLSPKRISHARLLLFLDLLSVTGLNRLIFLFILGAFGGLLGLCTGVSLLTGLEIIYFFTIRMLKPNDD